MKCDQFREGRKSLENGVGLEDRENTVTSHRFEVKLHSKNFREQIPFPAWESKSHLTQRKIAEARIVIISAILRDIVARARTHTHTCTHPPRSMHRCLWTSQIISFSRGYARQAGSIQTIEPLSLSAMAAWEAARMPEDLATAGDFPRGAIRDP